MGSKSGAFTVKKGFRKAKPGHDQEFTLQKGVSAAPIKQSRVTGTKKSIIEGAVIGGAAVGGWELGKKTSSSLNKKSKRPTRRNCCIDSSHRCNRWWLRQVWGNYN